MKNATEMKKISDNYKANSTTIDYEKAIKFIKEEIEPIVQEKAERGLTEARIYNDKKVDFKTVWTELNALGYKVSSDGYGNFIIRWSKPKVRKAWMCGWF